MVKAEEALIAQRKHNSATDEPTHGISKRKFIHWVTTHVLY